MCCNIEVCADIEVCAVALLAPVQDLMHQEAELGTPADLGIQFTRFTRRNVQMLTQKRC